MGKEEDLLRELGEDQKVGLLGALAELAFSDGRVDDSERALFLDFAQWLGVDQERAGTELERESDKERLRLADMPGKVRALVFTTGAMMVLVDGEFDEQEKKDLALLASSLGIAPDSARQAIRELSSDSGLREQLRESLQVAESVAESGAAERGAKRKVCLVLGMFVGFGVGVFAWPVVVPGAVVGLIAGAIGGGLLGRVAVENEQFEPGQYDFSDL